MIWGQRSLASLHLVVSRTYATAFRNSGDLVGTDPVAADIC